MRKYVIDASVVIETLLEEQYSLHARALFKQSDDDDLLIPEFCYLECANVLWKRVRFSGLPLEHAKRMIADLRELPLTIVLMNNLLERSLEIGLSHQLAIYDSAYIALAENLGLSLITADEKQANAAQAVGAKVKPLTDFSSPQPSA